MRKVFVLLFASVLSEFGDWLAFIAIASLTQSISKSVFNLGVYFSIRAFSTIVSSPLIGHYVDTHSKKSTLILMRTFQACAVAPLIFIHDVKLIFFIAFLLAPLDLAYSSALRSIIPELTDGDQLSRANAILSGGSNLLMVLGPAISGILLSIISFRTAFIIDSLSYLFAVVVLILFLGGGYKKKQNATQHNNRTANQNAVLTSSIFHSIKDIFSDKYLKFVGTSLVMLMLGGGAVNALMPAYAIRLGGTHIFGAITSAVGVGFFVGSAFMAWYRITKPLNVMLISLMLIAIADIGWAISSSVSVAIILGLINGIGNELFGTNMTTYIQQNTPRNQQGKRFSAISAISEVSSVLSSGLGGIIGTLFGLRVAFSLAGLAAVIPGVLGFFISNSAYVSDDGL